MIFLRFILFISTFILLSLAHGNFFGDSDELEQEHENFKKFEVILAKHVNSKEVAAKALLNGQKINIQNAKIRDFKVVPGLSEKLARQVISFRDKQGRITQMSELLKIRGIGNSKLQSIEMYFRLSDYAS